MGLGIRTRLAFHSWVAFNSSSGVPSTAQVGGYIRARPKLGCLQQLNISYLWVSNSLPSSWVVFLFLEIDSYQGSGSGTTDQRLIWGRVLNVPSPPLSSIGIHLVGLHVRLVFVDHGQLGSRVFPFLSSPLHCLSIHLATLLYLRFWLCLSSHSSYSDAVLKFQVFRRYFPIGTASLWVVLSVFF